MKLEQAYALLREFEGLRLHAYQDSVGVWTIGYGTTVGVHPGMVITAQQAEHLMEIDVQHRVSQLKSWITTPVTDNMLSAIVSLAYNIGMMAVYHSKMLHDLNAGASKEHVAGDFMSWTHAGGHVLPGLVNRRKAEEAIFLS